jgi:hypothetical protein
VHTYCNSCSHSEESEDDGNSNDALNVSRGCSIG